MIIEFLIKGIFIGLIFGMPIGAVGALSIQRILRHGAMAGLISGLASSFADIVYACVGAFGLTLISDFLFTYQIQINLIGAVLLLIIAIKMIVKKDVEQHATRADTNGYIKMFLSSFGLAITNPTAILSFLFAFSVFNIHGTLGMMNGTQLVIGVFIGTLCWWLLLVVLVSFMKKKITPIWSNRLNTVFGMMLIMFSCGIWVNTLALFLIY